MSSIITPQFDIASRNASMFEKGHLGQTFGSEVGEPILSGGNSIKLEVGFSPFRS